MNWKKELDYFEAHKKWDLAIQLMQKVINEKPDDLDAYLRMNYLLMNLLVEEDYDISNQDYYVGLLKINFIKSYQKFNQNAEYLFFTGITAFISEWYFDIEIEDAKEMIKQAMLLEPSNILYKWGYYAYLNMNDREKNKLAVPYAQHILEHNSSVQEFLKSKGALGNYLLNIIINWNKEYLPTLGRQV